MTPHCYFCGCELQRVIWTPYDMGHGFSITVASCKDCAEKVKE